MIPRTEKPEVRLDTMIAIWGDCPKALFMCVQFGFQYYKEELITSDEMLQCWNECKQHAINSANAETIQKLETQIAEYQKLLPNVVILPQQAQSGATNPKGTKPMTEKKLSKTVIKTSQKVEGMFQEPLQVTNTKGFWVHEDDFIELHKNAFHGQGINREHPTGRVSHGTTLLWCGNNKGRPIFMTAFGNRKPMGSSMANGVYFLGSSTHFTDNDKEAQRLRKREKARKSLIEDLKKQSPDDFAVAESEDGGNDNGGNSTCTDANEKTGTLASAISNVFKGRKHSGGRTRRSPVDAGTNTGLAMAGGAIGAGVLLGGGSDCGGSFGGGSSGGFDGGGSFGGGCGGD